MIHFILDFYNKYLVVRQNEKKNLLFRFRTDENALRIYVPNQCILVKILLNIEFKRL